MAKKFWQKVRPGILLLLLCLGVFALVFSLANLNWEYYFLAAAILLFIAVVYMVVCRINLDKTERLEEKTLRLEKETQALRNSAKKQRNDLENYFLLWVHQIKNPITAAKLLTENYSPEANIQLKMELAEIEKYTNMAMSYLKLTNPDTDMAITEVRLDDILQMVFKQNSLNFIHTATKLHYEEIDYKVLTDANWSAIMLEQIINNALKYAGGGDIWVYFNPETYVLSIKDNGRGIREADLPRIFQKGYSGFNGSLEEKSSGIGLYLVKMISAKLEQKIEVKSVFGAGTEFLLYFHRPRFANQNVVHQGQGEESV